MWHTGTLNPTDKQFNSLEGAGLSITTHPDEWRKITPLMGVLHQCIKNDHLFLNFHALKPEHILSIYEWGCKREYIEPTRLYRVSMYSFDFEMDFFQEFDNKEAALQEGYVEEDIEETDGYRALPKMEERVKGNVEPVILLGKLTTLYIEEVLTHLDGVWWDDELDVSIYSSPRGVIVPTKIPEWTFNCISDI